MTEHQYAVTVHRHNGEPATTTLHISSEDEAAQLRLIADDLGLVIDDHGFTEDDPEVRRITIRPDPDIRYHDRKLPGS